MTPLQEQFINRPDYYKASKKNPSRENENRFVCN